MKRTSYDRLSKSIRKLNAKRIRYPIWCAKSVGVLMAASIVVVTILVLLIGERSIFTELEVSLAIISVLLFGLLTCGLYRGVRVKREELDLPELDWKRDKNRKGAWLDGMDLWGLDVPVVGGEGCAGAIIGLLLGIVLLIVLGLFLYFCLPFIWAGVAAMIAGCFWVFNRALRVVFAKSRYCQGQLAKSVGYAFAYTLGYTGWLFALLYIGQRCLSSSDGL